MKKRVINLVIIICFLCNNCIDPLFAQSIHSQTLANVSPFNNPESERLMHKLLTLNSLLEGENLDELVRGLRMLFSPILNDEPDGLTVLFNPNTREAFVLGKGAIARIYKNKGLDIPVVAVKEFDVEGGIKIKVYNASKELIDELKRIKGLVLINGLPNPDYTPERMAAIVEKHLDEIGVTEGDKLVERYAKALTEAADKTITSARHAEVPDNLSAKGWLWMDNVPGLEVYVDTEPEENAKREARNALIIRDHIIKEGVQLKEGRHILSLPLPIDIRVWDGEKNNDSELNDIISENIKQLFDKMPEGEESALLTNIRSNGANRGIIIAILDKSKHWAENCRNDRFIGINRYLLSKIKEERESLEKELIGLQREEEINRLWARIRALEAYLQTYIYHELRHEASMGEDKLLGDIDMVYKAEPPDFEEELERRENGRDARYFTMALGGCYEGALLFLSDLGFMNIDSKFLHAAVIAGFVSEIGKHCNELVLEDFSELENETKPVKIISRRYIREYENLDMPSKETEWRGKISYILYQTGLTDHVRVPAWSRERGGQRSPDYELAKKYVLRMIDFISRYDYDYDKGVFFKRLQAMSYSEAAEELAIRLPNTLETGEFSQAVLRTELAFKTSGLIDTVSGNTTEFSKLVINAYKEQMEWGDPKFTPLDLDTIKRTIFERDVLPRLKILFLFENYLCSLPKTRFNQKFREDLDSLRVQFRAYLKGEQNRVDTDKYLILYDKLQRELIRDFEIGKDLYDSKKVDLLMALWEAFDFVDCISGHIKNGGNRTFSEPLFITGNPGEEEKDKTRFTREEIEDIRVLREVFKDKIRSEIVSSPDTKRRIQNILRIFTTKINKYRVGLRNIPERYGRDWRSCSGHDTVMQIKKSMGWYSAVWLSKKYGNLLKNGVIRDVLELDSCLSAFFQALQTTGVDLMNLSGIVDNISSQGAEYFGENPNRLSGDLVNGGMVNMTTGEKRKIDKEAYQLVVSVYKLQNISGSRKMYNIFREVHRILKYGGHFAITMPQTRMFLEENEAFKSMIEAMGFTIVESGVGFNEISEEVGRQLDPAIINRIRNKKFYTIIFKKKGAFKEGDKALHNKLLLLPMVISEPKGKRRAHKPKGAREKEDEDVKRPDMDYVLEGEGIEGRTEGKESDVAGNLVTGLAEGGKLKEKAENENTVLQYQESIRKLLDEVIPPYEEKLDAYVKNSLRARIGKVFGYANSDYTKIVHNELDSVKADLLKFKDFVGRNVQEFEQKLNFIREKSSLAEKLDYDDKAVYEKTRRYTRTDLSPEVIMDVDNIVGKFKKIEGDVQVESERAEYAEKNWEEFKKIQDVLRKYETVAEGKELKAVLKAEKEDLNPELMAKANRIGEIIAQKFSSEKTIKGLDSLMGRLFKCKNSEFLFSFGEIELLSGLKGEWIEGRAGRIWKEIMRDTASFGHFRVCIKIFELWELYSGEIDFDKGLAVFLKDMGVTEYMSVLDGELVFKPFMAAKGLSGRIVTINPLMLQDGIAQILGSVKDGEDVVIAIDDSAKITNDFIEGTAQLGFDIKNIYDIWLNVTTPDKRTIVGDFIRRGKKIIIANKKSPTPGTVLTSRFKLSHERKYQDYNAWLEVRNTAIQEINPSFLAIEERELLSAYEIRRDHPEWAEKCLDRGAYRGDFFDRNPTELSIRATELLWEKQRERREAEEERGSSAGEGVNIGQGAVGETAEGALPAETPPERQGDIIRKSREPLVGITYDDIWTKSKVRDLARIILRLTDNFSKKPDIGEIVKSTLIANHPQLRWINEQQLRIKIQELISYKEYDDNVYRMYNSFIDLMYVMFYESGMRTCTIAHEFGTEVLKRKGKELDMRFLHGSIAVDDSPFSLTEEGRADVLKGMLFELKQTGPSDEKKLTRRRAILHCLSDHEGILRNKFSGYSGELVIEVGEESLAFEEQILKGVFRHKQIEGRVKQDILQLFGQTREVFRLMKDVHNKKNINPRYMDGLADTMKMMTSYIFVRIKNNELDFKELIGLLRSAIEAIKKMLNEDMAKDEFAAFVGNMLERLNPVIEDGRMKTKAGSDSKRDTDVSSYSYLCGRKQDQEIAVSGEDKICTTIGQDRIKAKYYFDILKLTKDVRLYKLTDEEKGVLNNLADKFLSVTGGEEKFHWITEQIISYLTVDNTINRFVYFVGVSMSRIWQHRNISEFKKQLISITEGALSAEPKILIHTNYVREQNAIFILTELYRLKQMLDDDMPSEVKLEIQIGMMDLLSVINEKLSAGELERHLPITKKKVLSANRLRYDIAAIGNPYHIDLADCTSLRTPFLSRMRGFSFDISRGNYDEQKRVLIDYMVGELHLLFIYFPSEKPFILKKIAEMAVRERQNTSVRYFMNVFCKVIPSAAEELEALKRDIPKEASRPNGSISEQTLRILNEATGEEDLSQKTYDEIAGNTQLRIELLSAINNMLTEDRAEQGRPSDRTRTRYLNLADDILEYAENPEELIFYGRSVMSFARLTGNSRILVPYIYKGVASKIMEFAKDTGREKEVWDALCGNYSHYLEIRPVILACLDQDKDLRKYFGRMFVEGDYITSAYAYYYIKSFVKNSRQKEWHDIFLSIVDNILKKDLSSATDWVKLRRMLEIFFEAVALEPDFSLRNEWDRMIGKFRQGVISGKTLSVISSNVELIIEQNLHIETMTDEEIYGQLTRIGIINEDGENILGEEVRRDGIPDAYFGGMTDNEIDPQIKLIMEKQPENFIFIRGRSKDFGKGELVVDPDFTTAVRAAFNILQNDTREDNEYTDLQYYSVVIVKAVGFSGHYSAKRKRVYIPAYIFELTRNKPLLRDILIDFMEHEYLLSKGKTEEQIREISESKRPGIYEQAKKLHREYIVEMITDRFDKYSGLENLKTRLDGILKKAQKGEDVRLTPVQLQRLLWLIDRSNETGLVKEIAEALYLMLEPDYKGDPGQVIMAIEKEILAYLYTEEQLGKHLVKRNISAIGFIIKRTINGIRTVGEELPPNIENVLNFVDKFDLKEPAEIKETHYILVDKDRFKNHKTDIAKIEDKWGVRFVDKIPEEIVDKKDVVILVDPEDAEKYKGYKWYLPLVYSEKSFILSAWLAINKPEKIEGTPVFNYVKEFYEKLLGTSLRNEEVLPWFKNPCLLQDKIKLLSADLRLLRFALEQLDKSA